MVSSVFVAVMGPADRRMPADAHEPPRRVRGRERIVAHRQRGELEPVRPVDARITRAERVGR